MPQMGGAKLAGELATEDRERKCCSSPAMLKPQSAGTETMTYHALSEEALLLKDPGSQDREGIR